MKNKTLLTAMALAILAPSVTTFAATDNVVTGNQNEKLNSNLNINGQIYSDAGQAPSGQISMTLPTAVKFAVYDDSSVIGANGMKIQNNSSDVDVRVSIGSFSDSTSTNKVGITLVDQFSGGGASDYDRSHVKLTLTATNGQSVVLKHGMAESQLVDLNASQISTLSLTGEAGTSTYSEATHKGNTDLGTSGVTDDFVLTFNITKQ